MTRSFYRLLPFAAALLAVPALLPARADEDAPAGQSPPVVSGQQALKGGVRGAVLLTRDGLVKIEETARDLQKVSLALMAEVTRKNVAVVKEPNVLPNGVVIPPFPQPTGTIELGQLPPRPEQLRQLVRNSEYSVQLLQNEIAALIVPEEKLTTLSPLWFRVRSEAAAVSERQAALTVLCADASPDARKIGREALAVYDGTVRIQKMARQLARLVAGK